MKIIEDTRIKILSGTSYHIGMIGRVKDIKPNGDCTVTVGPEKIETNISSIDTNWEHTDKQSSNSGFTMIVLK